ncbi:MAG TPA: SCP2 sterol-binding domain-containing protein [Gaiellaceae bacterium]|jgi:putative sterol carrier protein|nr:SCP2 sterol-binding domain-containing protein [Gaiellaceae bacterium]
MVTKTNDPTERFFEALATHGHEPLLRKGAGSTRFEIVDGKRTLRWLVTVEKGDISVSRRNGPADCVVRAQKALFDRIVTGKMNAVAAVLRGDLEINGDWRLLVWMQRLFPGRHGRRRTGTAGYARRRR